MRIVWVGFHDEGVGALRSTVAAGYDVAAVLTLTEDAAALRSGAVDYGPVAESLGLALHRVRNINDESTIELLASLSPDLLIVLGWTQLLRDAALAVPTIGVVGAHASLLPRNRGRAPVNWAIIRGERVTGNSLMWLSAGVDSGDIIAQREFPIEAYDTCGTVYEKVAASNEEMVLELLAALSSGRRPGRPQVHSDDPLLPGRKPADGAIDWTLPAGAVYDLIRGVTRPYPGAFSHLDEERVTIWHSALLPWDSVIAAPGTCLGPVVSPVEDACGQLVACGTGAVVLLEVEADGRERLTGHELQALPWRGKVMSHG